MLPVIKLSRYTIVCTAVGCKMGRFLTKVAIKQRGGNYFCFLLFHSDLGKVFLRECVAFCRECACVFFRSILIFFDFTFALKGILSTFLPVTSDVFINMLIVRKVSL